jgi:hypothetical protein
MKLTSFEAIIRALNGAKARYLVAGGLAVNAHGYARFTNDVDLVIHLTKADILASFRPLGKPVSHCTPPRFMLHSNKRGTRCV